MTPETFCEQFATFAEAPNGVAKLRELILQLAVQGKLGTQDVNDEPASVVLAKVRAERERRIGEIPKQRPVSPITPDEQLFELPSGWTWARFGDLCLYIEAGSSPKCEERPRVGDEWGVIKISAVTWGRFNPDENKTLPPNLEPRIECEIRSGDFLMTRANTAELVAKSVVVHVTPPRLLLNDKTLRVVFPDSVSPQYVNLFNNGAIARQHYIRVASGTSESMRNVSRENVLEMPIPVPPLAEQRRIVGKVDQLLGLCDELAARQAARREARERLVGATLDRLVSASWDRLPACLSAAEQSRGIRQQPPSTPAHTDQRTLSESADTRQAGSLSHAHRLRDHFDRLFDTPTTLPQLRQAILQLAVQGQLVPQDPNDEPAINDLKEIEREKQAMIEARSLRPNRISEIEQTRVLQYQIPDSWRWFRLGDVAFFQEGPGIRNWQFRREGVKLLNVQNIVDGQLVLENSDRFVSIEEFEATYTHFRVEQGDILFASSGGSWGKTAWFEEPGYPVMLNTSMIRLKFYSKRCSDDYLLLFLRGQFFRKQMEIQLVGMQPNFGSTHLGRLYIPLPPLSEQKRIVSKVTELLSLCDALEAKLTQAESASTQLLSAAVHHLLQENSRGV